MIIAIDYDCTFTRDPEMWKAFIALARQAGHKVHCVTCRRPTDENEAELTAAFGECDMMIFFTSLKPKLDYMAARNITIDVWIDDDPGCVMMGK